MSVTNPLLMQVGGSHYKDMPYQPVQFIHNVQLGFLSGCIVKRICRYDHQTGKGRQDLEKIIHECLLLKQLDFCSIEPKKAFSKNKQKRVLAELNQFLVLNKNIDNVIKFLVLTHIIDAHLSVDPDQSFKLINLIIDVIVTEIDNIDQELKIHE
jgi:hypothetical protein